jgi:GTP-binding protein Era
MRNARLVLNGGGTRDPGRPARLPENHSMRFGTIAIVGRTNVGKSTFLNAALGEPLAIVSHLPQTTRDVLLGVVNREGAQLAFLDTPGLHRAHTELGRRMNAHALEAGRAADVTLFVTDVSTVTAKRRPGSPVIDPEDARLLANIGEKTPAIAVVNKIDLVRQKERLLPFLDELNGLRNFAAILPVSLRKPADVERVLEALEAVVPEGERGYPEDFFTDRPTSFFVREYVRESVLGLARGEVPHAVAVSIDEYDDDPKCVRIKATIHVEKQGQRKILVGDSGEKIKAIGMKARARIEELVGRKVFLGLFVRITPRWKSMPRQLAELGYTNAESFPHEEGEES